MAKTIDSNNALDTAEFYCPYCRDWITDVIHIKACRVRENSGEPMPSEGHRLLAGALHHAGLCRLV